MGLLSLDIEACYTRIWRHIMGSGQCCKGIERRVRLKNGNMGKESMGVIWDMKVRLFCWNEEVCYFGVRRCVCYTGMRRCAILGHGGFYTGTQSFMVLGYGSRLYWDKEHVMLGYWTCHTRI